MANELAQFITINDCIKSAMLDMGENSMERYPKYLAWCLRGVNELEFDVLQNFKRMYIGVDSATKTAKLPTDFVQWVRVGVIDQGNEVQSLSFNPNLAFSISQENCAEISKHCDCGCTDPVCGAVDQYTTTITDVVINGTTYQKTVTVCTKSNGTIVQRTCEPVVTNPTQECDYSVTINVTDGEGNPTVPFSNVVIRKNNTDILIGDVATVDVMKSVLQAYGFDTSTSTGTQVIATIQDSSDVWNKITYTTVLNSSVSVNFTQTNCATPTPIVETVCFDEEICKVEVLDCGCIVPTQLVVNTLASWGILAVEFSQRYLKQLDWQLPLRQPLSYFGYFNVDIYNGVIQLDLTFPFDTIYVEYYSANQVESSEYLVPVFAQEALTAYIKYKSIWNKNNVSRTDKILYQRDWFAEKKKCRTRLNPVRMPDLLDAIRMFPRP